LPGRPDACSASASSAEMRAVRVSMMPSAIVLPLVVFRENPHHEGERRRMEASRFPPSRFAVPTT
jgi:hypothetical protein